MSATQNPLDARVLDALRLRGGRLTVDQLADLLRVDRFSVAGALNRLGHLGAVRGMTPRTPTRQADGGIPTPIGKKKG
jgi:predicted transcriptional regulator